MAKRAYAFLLLGAAGLVFPTAVCGKELPPDVQRLLREAYPKERVTLINVVKRLYPDSTEDVDLLVKRIDQENRTKAGEAGFFQSLRGEVSAGGYLSTGNTRDWGVAAAAAIKRQTPLWVHSLDIRADVKNEDKQRTDERLFAGYSVRRNFKGSRWFISGGLRFERDRFGGIDWRLGEYVGAGYQIVDRDNLKWEVIAGPGHRNTHYSGAPSENQFGIFARTTVLWKLSDTLRFDEDLTAAVAKGDDTYSSLTSVTTDIYGQFALRLSLAASIESEPPPERKKVETYTRASLVYTFEP